MTPATHRRAPSARPGDGRVLAELRRALRNAASPVAGFDLQAYLGSPVPALQVRTPEVRRIAREFDRQSASRGIREIERLTGALWGGSVFEERILGLEILARHRREFDDRTWAVLDGWVDGASGWGLVDSLASGPISEMVPGHPRRFQDLLRWGRSPNLWRRRASLYGLARTIRSGDLDRALRVIDPLRADPERWVQRAVGTWVRECWKGDAPRISAYLERRAPDLAPVSLTVALERASPEERARLRGIARTKRTSPQP